MRAALKLLAICVLLWGASFAIRHGFLADVVPIADAEQPQSNWAVQAVFLLATLENLALMGGVILLGVIGAAWFKGRAGPRPLSQGRRWDLT